MTSTRQKVRYKVTLTEKHELTLSFNSSDELWSFAKKYQDKIVSVADYKICTCDSEPQTELAFSEYPNMPYQFDNMTGSMNL